MFVLVYSLVAVVAAYASIHGSICLAACSLPSVMSVLAFYCLAALVASYATIQGSISLTAGSLPWNSVISILAFFRTAAVVVVYSFITVAICLAALHCSSSGLHTVTLQSLACPGTKILVIANVTVFNHNVSSGC